MKMNNKIKFKLIVIALLSVIIVAFTHCGPQTAREIGDGGGYEKLHSDPLRNNNKDEGQVLTQMQVTTGVKNYEQILATMGAVTGINPYSNTSIMNVYRQVESSLPTENNIKIYTATQQVAVTKLAAEFCFQLTQGTFAAQRQAIWPDMNISEQARTALTENKVRVFIDDTIEAFWGGMVTQEEYELALVEFFDLVQDLKGNDTNSAATARVVRGVCTAALSSAYVTLL